MLLIHERRMQRTLNLDGPTASNLQIIRETLALLETAEEIEKQGFADLRKAADCLLSAGLGNMPVPGVFVWIDQLWSRVRPWDRRFKLGPWF
jgi:hypothetical protein